MPTELPASFRIEGVAT